MRKVALVLSVVSLLINIVTMMYIEIELSGVVPPMWRMALMATLVLITFRQVASLKRNFPELGEIKQGS